MSRARAAWAAPEDLVVSYHDDEGIEHLMPPDIKKLLISPFRGQKCPQGLAPHLSERAVYTPPAAADTKPTLACIKTEITFKASPSMNPYTKSCGAINFGALYKPFLNNKMVSSEDKFRVASSANNAATKAYLESQPSPAASSGATELDNAERAAKVQRCEAVGEAAKRQSLLDSRTVTVLNAAQGAAILFAMALMFFACNIPFNVALLPYTHPRPP